MIGPFPEGAIMVRMRPVSMILASASLAVLLSACGSDIHPGDQTAQAPSASSGNAGNNNVADRKSTRLNSSHW